MKFTHIVPIGDLIEHNTESCECACNPELDLHHLLAIHAAMDRREVFEQQAAE